MRTGCPCEWGLLCRLAGPHKESVICCTVPNRHAFPSFSLHGYFVYVRAVFCLGGGYGSGWAVTVVSEVLARDPKGLAIVKDCRVYVPPRWHGKPHEVAPPHTDKKQTSNSISGRVTKVYQGKRGVYVEIQGFDLRGFYTVPSEVVRVQRGLHNQEKLIETWADKKKRAKQKKSKK